MRRNGVDWGVRKDGVKPQTRCTRSSRLLLSSFVKKAAPITLADLPLEVNRVAVEPVAPKDGVACEDEGQQVVQAQKSV